MISLRFGLYALALLVSVPFLLPWHTTPIPSFYAEWWAIALGLLTCLTLFRARNLPMPGISWLALVLATAGQLQVLLGISPLPTLAHMTSLALCWAALLACAARFLADELGVPLLAKHVAAGLAIGASLLALLALLHPWLAPLGWPGFSARDGGLLGQANHFSSYVWLGLASLIFLYGACGLPKGLFWSGAVLLTLAVALAGQRSSFLYALVIISFLPWRRMSLAVGLLFIVMQPAAWIWPVVDGGGQKPPAAVRMVQAVEGPSIRLQLLRVGWEGIVEKPWFGNGVGAYPTLALRHADVIPAEHNPGPAESAHNLIVDLAVTYGVPATLLVLGAGIVWLWCRRAEAKPESAWAATLFAVLATHALIEYPLAHTYFLGTLAVIAGMFGYARSLGSRLLPFVLTLAAVVAGMTMLAETRRDYRHLETALALGKQPEWLAQSQALLLKIPADSLFAPWVATTACTSLDPLSVTLADGLAVCHMTMLFSPTVERGMNTIVLMWRAGDTDRAKDLLNKFRGLKLYYPGSIDSQIAIIITEDARLNELIKP